VTASFEGQAALVTGATGDIGAAIAVALAERGAGVGLLGRRRTKLAAVERRLGDAPRLVREVDLTADQAVRSAVKAFLRAFGRLDVLVHSNGVHEADTVERTKLADADRMWAANVRGPLLLTQLALPALRASKGQIVFVNSSVGLETRPGVGIFAATQHALHALAETLRAEVNPDGIRVLSVYPGRTATGRQRKIFVAEGRDYAPERLLQPEDLATIVIEALALPRTAEVTSLRIRPLVKP
jgi:NADP-dependent 3-hydroxy acid dehydrogenase YdfG